MTQFGDVQTKEAILRSAKKHFLQYGYAKASLNRIVADAGFTKGAFYGYFNAKEELFCALVDDTVKGVREILENLVSEWKQYPPEEQIYHMSEAFLRGMPQLVDFVFAHHDEVFLLLKCADGTRYGNFLTDLQTLDVSEGESNIQKTFGVKLIDEETYRIMMFGYFSMLREVFLSGMTKEKMISVITDIQNMCQNGIMALLNAKKEQQNGKENL